MKVAKCCESKEPELLTFEQIKEREGVYISPSWPAKARVIVVASDGAHQPTTYAVLYYHVPSQTLEEAGGWWGNYKFRRTSETLCVGLKDANGKWVE